MLVEMQVRSTDTVPDLPYLMGEAGRGVCHDRGGGVDRIGRSCLWSEDVKGGTLPGEGVGLLPVRRTGSRVVERVDCLERIGEIWVGDLWWVRAALYLT